jgi:hypothetical protein
VEFIEFVGLKNKATTIEVGLLLNFGRKPEFKKFVHDNKRKKINVRLNNRWSLRKEVQSVCSCVGY